MALEIIINTVTNQDYDGVDETVKEVCVKINDVLIKEYYSYEDTVADSTINTEVTADLTAKGYNW